MPLDERCARVPTPVFDGVRQLVRRARGRCSVGTMTSIRMVLGLALGWLAALAAGPARAHDPAEGTCGASHASDVREILRFRDPGAPLPGVDDESTLGLDRALIIDDFLRLKSMESASLTEAVRSVDEALLRRLRDSGEVTPEICAVVRFMHGYYAGGRRPPGRTPDVAAGPVTGEPAAPAVATPRPARNARATRELELQRRRARQEQERRAERARAQREAERAAAAEPEPTLPEEVDVASIEPESIERDERERRDAQAAILRSTAQSLIAELEQQLRVPRYLSFREARTEAPDIATDELEARRRVSLRAAERAVALLTQLGSEPTLRDAVQVALGTDGRARVEQAINLTFKSVPDARQRERVLRLWSELEAAARVKR
jgi:hypothetical protein